MSLCTTRGVGQYVAAEAHTAAYGRPYKPALKRPIIYFTGGPGDDRYFLTNAASGSQITPAIVDSGMPVMSAAFGGTAQYGNDTSQTRIGQAWTYVKTLTGCKTDKFIGIGVSKGFTALLNYTRNNPSNVAALVGIVPGVNLPNAYIDNPALNTEMDAAYTDHTGWLAAMPTHDPFTNAFTHASQGIPMKLIFGESDTVVRPMDVTFFGSIVGAEVQTTGATDHLTTAPQIVPSTDVLPFITPYL